MKEIKLKEEGKIKRLTNQTFKFDDRLRSGWYSSEYFLKAKKIVEEKNPNNHVLMQFFQKKDNTIVCGLDEVIALLDEFCDLSKLRIKALHDGDVVNSFETVLTIEGPYQEFGYLEGVIDGILARRSSIATNVYNVVKSANGKDIIFMGDRDDDYKNQQGDGYAAYIGGVKLQSTAAMNDWWGSKGLGTMPHSLIQNFNGDTLKAAKAYLDIFTEEKITCLVDYENDCIKTSLKLARALKHKLNAVRVDTSEKMMDQFFIDNNLISKDYFGVNEVLIQQLRKELDNHGFDYVKIVVSGGFDANKIKRFEQKNVPVDYYGVGNSLLAINISFTGDCVLLDNNAEAKVGREFKKNMRLEEVK